jgi:signal transduction histidine kinase
MNNLISNAIKYGHDGKYIGLNLSFDDKFVYVEIWDKGKGIDITNIEKVFERMYTLEDSRNKLYQGSGLGLTITKRLVDKLGGEISLMSKHYERTSFTFKLKRILY